MKTPGSDDRAAAPELLRWSDAVIDLQRFERRRPCPGLKTAAGVGLCYGNASLTVPASQFLLTKATTRPVLFGGPPRTSLKTPRISSLNPM
jgi:hypothetical protein